MLAISMLSAGLAISVPCTAQASTLPVVKIAAPHAELVLEVARSEEERAHGLMDRPSLAPHHGMIFAYASDGARHFWMKHTLVPLDMVFLDASGRITSIAAKVPAAKLGESDAAVARRNGFGRYVIELPAGETGADGLISGAHLQLPAFP